MWRLDPIRNLAYVWQISLQNYFNLMFTIIPGAMNNIIIFHIISRNANFIYYIWPLL